MANSLNLPEVTLAQLCDSTHSVNDDGWWSNKLAVRVTGHKTDTAAEEDNPEVMAIFERSARGHPWMKRGTLPNTKVYQHTAGGTIPDDATTYYPDFDYTEFE